MVLILDFINLHPWDLFKVFVECEDFEVVFYGNSCNEDIG